VRCGALLCVVRCGAVLCWGAFLGFFVGVRCGALLRCGAVRIAQSGEKTINF
jgi:hypothetical protein